MKLRLTRHAREKLSSRRLSLNLVKQTLKSPSHRFEDAEHEALVNIKRFGKLYVVVIHVQLEEYFKVITAYYTRKLDELVEAKTRRGAWIKLE